MAVWYRSIDEVGMKCALYDNTIDFIRHAGLDLKQFKTAICGQIKWLFVTRTHEIGTGGNIFTGKLGKVCLNPDNCKYAVYNASLITFCLFINFGKYN